MDLLIPVRLNNPSKLKERQILPKRRYKDIQMPVSWLLVGLRILTSILYYVSFALEVVKMSDPFRYLPILIPVDFVVVIMLSFPTSFKDRDDYNKNNELAIVISCKNILVTMDILARLFTTDVTQWPSLAAAVVCLSIELFMYRQYNDYYEEQFAALEEGMIEELKVQYGDDHIVGEATRGRVDYEMLPDTMEEKFWERVEDESKKASLVPSIVHWREDGSDISDYFVDLHVYLSICKNLRKNYNWMKSLAADCKAQRKELTEQNELIVQLRKKLCDSNADCSDIEEVPDETDVPALRIQEKAEGLFNCSDEDEGVRLSVSLGDYCEVAKQVAIVMGCIGNLKKERVQLNKALKTTRKITKKLLETMVRGNGDFEVMFTLLPHEMH